MLRITCPYQSDFELAIRTNPIRPANYDIGVRTQIWNAGGNPRQVGAKNIRQTEEVHVEIEWRKRFAGHNDGVDPFKARHQANGLLANREHHRCAASLQHRRVANELDQIADALLGTYDDRFPV